MMPLSSQQRLQYKLGLRHTDRAILEVGVASPCAFDLAERLERCFGQLPNRNVELRPASKYDALPALFNLNTLDPRLPSIEVTARSQDRLEISFVPLLWDVFSIVKMVQASLDPDSADGEIFQQQSVELLRHEMSHVPPQVAHGLADQLGLASPKTRRTHSGTHCYFDSISRTAVSDFAPRLGEIMAARCLHAATIVWELPIVTDIGRAVGNLSYFVASMLGGRLTPMASLADQLAAHAPLAAHPDKVAAAPGLTVLPYVPGIERIVVLEMPRTLAAHLIVYPSETHVHVSGTYSAAEFDERESAAHFRDVMAALGGDKFLATRAASGRAKATTIAGMLADALGSECERIAVSTAIRCYSRADLLQSAYAIGARILVGARQIGICCTNSFEFVAAVVACVLRGVSYVPLDPKAGRVRLADIISSSALEAVLCSPATEALVAAIGATPVIVAADTPGCAPIVHAGGQAPIYRIHTSGTTGVPKAVDVSSRNLLALFNSYADISPDIYRSTWGFTSSIGFDASVKQYLGPLLFGGTVFIPARGLTEDPVGVLQELKNAHVGVLNLTPQLLRIAVDAGLCNFDYVLVSGDVLPPRLAEDFFQRAGPSTRLINLYGPTETTINAMFYDVSREIQYRSVPLGRALGDSVAEVQDAAATGQRYCRIGSLQISGDIVTSGDRDADGVRFTMRNGRACFDTGDQCFVWYDDLVYFVGRRDSQVKVNGVRVDLHEVAQRIRGYLNVATCYAAVHGARLFVVLRRCELPEGGSPLAELGDHSRFGHLSLTPLVLDEIPLNMNGKVDLERMLASEQQAAPSGGGAPMEDVFDLEVHTMLRAVAEQRGLADVGMDDDLFAHGFDSLLTMEFALELNNRFRLDLAPGELVAHPTARKLAALLRSAELRTGLVHTVGMRERERLFVLLPPVLGNGLIFTSMANTLAANHLVAVCNYPSEGRHADDMEHIASAIACELRRQRLLRHRIDVVGYSMGASVGFELCRQLAAEFRVESLTILDKPVVPRHDLRQQQKAGEKLLDKLLDGRDPSPALKAQILADLQRNIDATFHYAPRGSIAVPARLFICTREDPPVRPDEWGPHLRGGLTVMHLPCRHEDVLDKPHVDSILAALSAPLVTARAFEVQEALAQ